MVISLIYDCYVLASSYVIAVEGEKEEEGMFWRELDNHRVST